jgi:hypothetical protein
MTIPGREEGPGMQHAGMQNRARLFAHLPASQPNRERGLVPWIIAALLHVPVVYLFFTGRLDGPVNNALLVSADTRRDEAPPEIIAPPALLPTTAPAQETEPSRSSRSSARAPRLAPIDAVSPVITTPGAPSIPGPASDVVGGTGSVVDRLAAPHADARLLPPMRSRADLGTAPVTASMAERLRLFHDSLKGAEAALRRANDWTARGSDGSRWGISNLDGVAALHVGRFTLPLGRATNKGKVPDLIRPPAGRREEANARVERWAEIETQARRVESRDSFEARVEEIRKRKQAAREKLVTRR